MSKQSEKKNIKKMLGYVLQAKRKNAGFDIFQKVISWPPKIHTILVSGRGHRKLDTRNVRGCDSNSGG